MSSAAPSKQQSSVVDIALIAPKIQGPQGADRMFIVGETGSGKTYLLERMLPLYRWEEEATPFRALLLLIDPNGTLNYPANELVETPEGISPTPKRPVVLYRPTPTTLDVNSWNEVFRRAFYTPEPLMLVLDETLAADTLFRKTPEGGNYLIAYLTRGRARGKGGIFLSQQPVNIPRTIIRQAQYFAMFDLNLRDDRVQMAGVIGETAIDGTDIRAPNALGRYEYWLKTPDLPVPVRARVEA